MAILATLKNVLEQNAEQLRQEKGFLSDVGYALNATLVDLTPDTAHGSTADHLKMVAVSLGETLKAAGGGVKHALWDGKNEFVSKTIQVSRVKNPLGQAGLATFYTGLYYLKAFTFDAVVGIGKGFASGAKAIANAQSTEEALLGVGEIYGSVGAAAGMVAGGANVGQVVSKIGSSTFTIPVLNGSEIALAAVTVPTGALVAGTMPGGIGIVLMSAIDEGDDIPGGVGKTDNLDDPLEGYIRATNDLRRRDPAAYADLNSALVGAIRNNPALERILQETRMNAAKEVAQALIDSDPLVIPGEQLHDFLLKFAREIPDLPEDVKSRLVSRIREIIGGVDEFREFCSKKAGIGKT